MRRVMMFRIIWASALGLVAFVTALRDLSGSAPFLVLCALYIAGAWLAGHGLRSANLFCRFAEGIAAVVYLFTLAFFANSLFRDKTYLDSALGIEMVTLFFGFAAFGLVVVPLWLLVLSRKSRYLRPSSLTPTHRHTHSLTRGFVRTQSAVPPRIPGLWWDRNRRWVIPAVAIACLVTAVCFTGGAVLMAVTILKGSEAYTGAIAQVESSSAVLQVLGEPVQPGWWVSGSISLTGPSGTADFSTSLEGPHGSGVLYVTAKKQGGRWEYTVLEVAVKGKRDRIDLLHGRDGI